MGTINRGVVWIDGQFLTAADLNGEFNIIHDEFNGNIDDANIKTAAAIAGSKISPDFGQQAVTLQELAVNPSALTNKGRLYTKDVSGGTELFYKDASGNVVQITSGGNLIGGLTTLPGYIYDSSIAPNSVSPTSKIDISIGALEIDVAAANSPEIIEVSSTIVIDMTVEGKNGFEANPTTLAVAWYFPYVVYNPTTKEVAGVMSASATSPTLSHASLSGFTKFRRVGSIYNTASGSASIRDFVQVGKSPRRQYLWTGGPLSSVSNGSSQTYSSVSLSTLVPSTADVVVGLARCTTATTSVECYLSHDGTNDQWHMGVQGETGFDGIGQYRIILETAQTYYYRRGDTGSNVDFFVTGYEESL
jgi:hypothetical protein